MALTTEQQAQVDLQTAIESARVAAGAAETAKNRKMEILRMAKEILVENRRTQAAADAVNITSATLTPLAEEITTYVNS